MRTSSSSTHNISVRALRRIRDFYIFNGDVIHQESTFDTTMKSLHAAQRHLCGLCLLFAIKFSSILSSFLHWISVIAPLCGNQLGQLSFTFIVSRRVLTRAPATSTPPAGDRNPSANLVNVQGWKKLDSGTC